MFFQCRPRHPRPPPSPRPACIEPGCFHKAIECTMRLDGHGFLSLHCKDHACRQRLGSFMCPNPKEPGLSKYCSDHSRCQAEGCTMTRRFADSGLAFAYCQKHTCFLEGCALKRSPNSSMCSIHTPLCLIPTCHDPRSSTGLYCASHSCADSDCDAVISGGTWCRTHASCAITGCLQLRVAGALCAQHVCLVRDCDGPRRDTFSTFCSKHACQTAQCPNVAIAVSPSAPRHCASHTCTAPECLNPRIPEGRYCPGHNAWLFEEVRPIMPEIPSQPAFPSRARDTITPAEEALARRLRKEEDRLRTRDQLERDMRRWNEEVAPEPRMVAQDRVFTQLPEPVPWKFPSSRSPITRRRPRTRSRDSGLGSSAWGSDQTFIS
ncbi:hypothetical protein F5X68DRAFT_242029 [Plectosphaerella plurivora]|uniref:Uncharacterized protein n=1 Tax=Plectosphaerella plurivora TaxID=936078 RepID=A0A9P9A9D8_9PEZI|nr:hypothetical protein F5X68DRAFT_242029 [Plectosphaerella plurivora]